ncbi:MAG: hypothetical protein EAX81_06725 [Candidatus Thorarchaeota archaeon]|nr:hypothetical protein [Candidatus Thorarchaeota archaeon]
MGHNVDVFSLAIDDEFVYSDSGEVWWGDIGSSHSSSFETTIRVWKKTWECMSVLEGHSDNANSISVNDKAVYSTSDNGTIRAIFKADWTFAGVVDLGVGPLKCIAIDRKDLYTCDKSEEVYRVPKASFGWGVSNRQCYL